MNIVAVEGTTKEFQTVRAVGGLSFEIRKGEIFALLGPNGGQIALHPKEGERINTHPRRG